MIVASTSADIVRFTLAGTSKKVPTREVTEVRRMLLSESWRQIFFEEQDCLYVVKIAGQIPTLCPSDFLEMPRTARGQVDAPLRIEPPIQSVRTVVCDP